MIGTKEEMMIAPSTRLDIDPGDPGWVVMADPEGNEFGVLHQDGQLPAKRTPAPQ